VDVVLTFAASDASRAAGMALLSTPLLQFDGPGGDGNPDADAVAAADRELADALFVGGRARGRRAVRGRPRPPDRSGGALARGDRPWEGAVAPASGARRGLGAAAGG